MREEKNKLRKKFQKDFDKIDENYRKEKWIIENLTGKHKKRIPLKEKRDILYELQDGGHPKTPFAKREKMDFYFYLTRGKKYISKFDLQQNLLRIIKDEENEQFRKSQHITNYLLATGVILTAFYYLIELINNNIYYSFLYSILIITIIIGLFRIK